MEGDIKDIAIGKDGNIWIANLYGLTNFNIHTKEFGIVGKNEGMQESELQSVFIDKKEQVWVVGNRFFARYNQSDNTFHNYLISKEILHFQSKVKHVAEDGTILLGSINGIYAFHPDNIRKNQQAPNVILTNFKVRSESYLLNQSYEETKNIVLSHDENDIAFEFSGLHYINPEANEYKCKLMGYDATWKQLGNEHKVSYTNLNPGRYTFKATASNSDGVWNEKGMTIHLTITPAFWQTLWFESLIILVLSIGYALIKNRQNQLALKRQKEMAEQNAAYKTMFLADVSHEIRTPMNAIIGLSKLALDTNLDAKQFKFIKAIRQSSQNLLSIINDLLDHTKLESGKFTFVKKAFELNEITEQLSDTLKFKAEEINLEFEINVSPRIPRLIIGDPLRLTQILTNLLGNSLKFTEQGKVWLHVKKVLETDQDVRLKFEVGDTGKGIAESQLEHIFESFQQAGLNNEKQAEGTGLGLSIARQLVEKQGGQLFIESELNKGTKLWFELTFGKQLLNEAATIIDQQALSLPEIKILVVEDNYFNQLVISEILEKYVPKDNIEIAGNGKIGLEKCNDKRFDIIVMDVKMPVLDGYETTKIIRNSEDLQLKDIPILAVTANALPNQLEKCLQVGMNDYVTKPVDENLLIEKISLLTKTENQIDREGLKKLLVNDEKKVEKYLAIFKSQIPTQLESLKDYLSSADYELVSNTAHNIKSQCKFLGLHKIADQAFEVEQSAENKIEVEQIPKMVEKLKAELKAVIEKEFNNGPE